MIDTQAVRAGEDGVPFDTPLGAGAADLRRLVLGAADGSLPNVKLLPRQTFDGTAVDVVDVTVAIFKTRLYIDPTDGAIRGWDEALSTAPNGQLMMSVRVTQREVVPLSATSAALFTLGAPATATVYQPLDAYPHPTVAQAVALSGSQAPLLAGDAHGFRLRDIIVSRLPERTIIDYQYEAHPRHLGALDAQIFDVQVWRWSSATGDHRLSVVGPSQTISYTTVTGQRVQAIYTLFPGNSNSPQRDVRLQYQDGPTTTVSFFYSIKMRDRDEFSSVLGALVDETTNSATVAQLQRELGGDTP